jgi:hypothetical protein
LAALRADWSRQGPQFTIAFGGRRLTSEFSVGARLLWSGASDPELLVNGERLNVRDDIGVVCMFHDDDVEYVELELEFEQGWKIQRQILLAGGEQFLLLADAVLGQQPARLEYRCGLPTAAAGATVTLAAESREGWIEQAGRRAASVLPLALPEWRSEPFAGELLSEEGGLVLQQQATARALYCPLFFDFDRRRLKQELTWRRLTVAEERRVQAPHAAVAYRVQVGKRQWLAYRSLTGKANRTVLGQHLLHEYLVGRFRRNGKLNTLLQIEAPDE